jgi:predicted nucleic acid-binding protein
VLVVDASIISSVVADSGPDGGRYRDRIRGEQLAAPDLLRIEVLSVLRRQLRAGTIDETQAANAVNDLLDLPIAVFATQSLLRRGWELRSNVTAYDACYVALAETIGCTLLTADARLARAPGAACPIEVLSAPGA